MSNETLYRSCKSFADNGFNVATSDISHHMCFVYIVGVGEASNAIKCNFGGFGAPYDKESLNAVIQDYVNRMKEQPEDWRYTAAVDVMVSLANINGVKCENDPAFTFKE